MALSKWARGDVKGVQLTVFNAWKHDALVAAGERKTQAGEAALEDERGKLEQFLEDERKRHGDEVNKYKTEALDKPISLALLVPALFAQESGAKASSQLYSQIYAAKRSDYYLRRAAADTADWTTEECHALLEAALEIDKGNASVLERARKNRCHFQESLPLAGPSELQIGGVRQWPKDWTFTTSERDLFETPLGFLHASELHLRDWRHTLRRFGEAAVSKFQEVRRQQKHRSFVDLNNHFFQHQDTDPFSASAQPGAWPELYSSDEYKEWAQVSRNICTSFIHKLGVPLSKEEAESLELVTWAAVYPKSSEPVTHYYHAHQESIVSFVLYVKMPEPTTPLTISDPRGAPPVEDFEWYQDLGDLGVDGDPPFHRPVEFYAEEGDILIFPSFAIHKVPPHIGDSTRVVFPTNCHLPKKFRSLQETFEGHECPLDGWERIARWQAPMAARSAIPSYAAHAMLTLEATQRLPDPYMKLWEVQNQVLAMLQFGATDPNAWLAAGNISAKAAVLLDSRGEGKYYLDAALMFARALRLDPNIQSQLDICLKQLIPKKVKKNQKDAYRSLSSWRKLILSWGREAPDIEVSQFLHEDVNGVGRCSRMCAKKQEPIFRTLRLLPAFGTRIYVLHAGREKMLEAAIAAAKRILEEDLPQVQVTASPLEDSSGWKEGASSASLTAVLCSGGSNQPNAVLLADPRGRWAKNWPGSVQARSQELAFIREPKAPFHWHREVPCEAGSVILLPAWLQHQTTAPRYALTATVGTQTLARRVPCPLLSPWPLSRASEEL
eukprot:symbB.v1.2.008406.t1/scaffold526.1/size209645/7